MFYYNNTYNNQLVLQVRRKGYIIPGKNPNILRKDECGARIMFDKYGDRNSKFGREIDHIKPVSLGGPDLLYNLRPLQRENNLSKSNGKLVCKVRTL